MHPRRSKLFCVTTGWCVMVAAMLLLLPVKFVLCWLLSAFIHELFHLLCICFCGTEVHHISVGAGGAVIQTGPMDANTEVKCALAGPFSGIILLLFVRVFPLLAICAAVQTIFNLLPLHPFDGGRVLVCILSGMKNVRTAYLIRSHLEWFVLAVLSFLSIIALLAGLGPVPVIWVLVILIRNGKIKIPCKAAQQIVQ